MGTAELSGRQVRMLELLLSWHVAGSDIGGCRGTRRSKLRLHRQLRIARKMGTDHECIG